jgi:hypothetical protein
VLGELMAQIERDNLDVLRFKYQSVRIKDEGISELGNEREYEVFLPYKRDQRLDNDYSEVPTDGVSFLNSRMNTQCYAVMFIIKRSLLIDDRCIDDRCLFSEGIYFEDTDWTPRMLCRAKRVASNEKIVYNYLVREGSITNAVNRSKQKKVLDDKMRLIEKLQNQRALLRQSGREYTWFDKMIADNVISIIGILSTQFYLERKEYLEQLRGLKLTPIQSRSFKAGLINLSPRFAIELLHLKNS